MDEKLYRIIPFIMVLLGAAVAARTMAVWFQIDDTSGDTLSQPASVTAADSLDEPGITPEAWSVFRSSSGPAADGKPDQYRLAGTFFLLDPGTVSEGKRLAIIDDVANGGQYMVSEDESFQGHEVLRIYRDRVVLRKDGRELELELSFSTEEAGEPAAENGLVSTNAPAYPETRFGQQIADNRWVFNKERLNEYYRELLNNPGKIAAIYMSMKPDYLDGKVGGYRVENSGAEDFFSQVGLNEGDVIRKVNSMRMTSQKRAEYFLSEFAQDRLGAIVLDIERNGEEQKLIYLFR